MKPSVLTGVALAAAVMAWTWGLQARAGEEPKGKTLYESKCVNCHGKEGRGDGPMGKSMKPPASDLTRSTLSDEDFLKIVREGGKAVGRSPLMTAQKSLSEAELKDLLAFAKSLRK